MEDLGIGNAAAAPSFLECCVLELVQGCDLLSPPLVLSAPSASAEWRITMDVSTWYALRTHRVEHTTDPEDSREALANIPVAPDASPLCSGIGVREIVRAQRASSASVGPRPDAAMRVRTYTAVMGEMVAGQLPELRETLLRCPFREAETMTTIAGLSELGTAEVYPDEEVGEDPSAMFAECVVATDGEICCVTLEPLPAGSTAMSWPGCGHVGLREGFVQWVQHGGRSCPLCRAPL